jgi:hypothetical protein
MSVRADLDALINWYVRNDPNGKHVIPVCATENTVKHFARKGRKLGAPYMYRGYEIQPMRKPRKEWDQPSQQDLTPIDPNFPRARPNVERVVMRGEAGGPARVVIDLVAVEIEAEVNSEGEPR